MILLFALLGCTPTCDDVCVKLVECGNEGTELLNADDCSDQCKRQQTLYDHWSDLQLRDAFEESLNCYRNSTCDEIAAGACYNQDIWSY